MKKYASFYLLINVFLIILVGGCGQAVQSPAPTISPTVTTTIEPPDTTSILIDGTTDDWAERPAFLEDPAGDARLGYLDITSGRVFVNQDSLYILLETADPTAPFALFDMVFRADDRTYQITYQPSQTRLFLVDYTNGTGKFVKYLENSTGAFNTALELRLDLDDLGRPGNLAVAGIGVMANTDAGWESVDRWEGGIPPVVNEVDPPRVGSEESRYFHARYWDLPDTYVGESLFTSPIANNAYIARSQSGTVYTTMSFGADPGISLVDIKQATATPILKLPYGIGMSYPVGGPGDTLLLGVGGEVWQVNPDGTHKIWGPSPNAFPIYYSNDGRLIGRSFDGRLVEIKQDGTNVELASGFQLIGDVVVTSEGVILVYDIPTGDIVRVSPDGAKRVLVPAVMPGEGTNFGIDFDNQIYYTSGGASGLKRLDVDTGKVTTIPSAFSPCAWNPGDIVFIEPGKFLLTGNQLSWSNMNTQETGILVHGFTATFAADIGPDGALYIGASGCGEEIPAQILRMADDGTKTVYVDNLRGAINQISFTPDGGLYIASLDNGNNHLLYLSAGEQLPIEIPGAPLAPIMSMAVDPISGNLLFTFPGGLTIQEYDQNGIIRQYDYQFPAAINEFRLAFASDGTLYGLAGLGISNTDFRGPWILKLDLTENTYTVLAELSHLATGVMSVFTVDDQGNLWVIVNPDSKLYQITPGGTITPFASNLPVDMPAIRLDQSGDIYFTCAEGIFRLYREP